MTVPSPPSPGFYPEPGSGRLRYWTGSAWGDYAPVAPGATAYIQTSQGTNGMAVASLVLGLLWIAGIGSLLAIVFSVTARKQIAQRGEGGSGLATAGLVLGIVGVIGAVIWLIAVVSVTNSVNSNYGY